MEIRISKLGCDRTRPRSVLVFIGAFAAMISPAALAAGSDQTGAAAGIVAPVAPPVGWRHAIEQGVNTYLKGEERAEEAVVMTREVPASTDAEVDAVTARLFPALGCKGSPPASRAGSVGPFGDGSIGPFGKASRCFSMFARSAGGYRIAVGAAITPQAEQETIRLARRLSGAGIGPGDGSSAPGVADVDVSVAGFDVKAVDAALTAALDAVPKRNLPVHMTLRRGFRYTGTNIELDYRLWMLFADGFATSCTKWDPALQPPTRESLASLIENTSCDTTRWRPLGDRAVFDDRPEDEPVALEDGPPPVRGTTFAGHFKSSEVLFSNLDSFPGPKQLLIDSTAMSLAHDGRFQLGAERYELSGPDPNRTGRSLIGRYLIDRFLMATSVDGKIKRHFFFALGKPTDKDLLIYFDGSLLSNH